MDFTAHVSEAGEEYNEKMEIDPNKRTELFQVPARPEVDGSDSLISKHFLPISLPKFQAPRDDGVQPLARSISSKQKSKRSKPLPNDA